MSDKLLELDGYIFRRVSNNLNKDGSTGWRCYQGKKDGCPASCRIGTDGEILRYRNTHDHRKPTQEEIDFIKVKRDLKGQLDADPEKALKMFDSVKRKLEESEPYKLQGGNSLGKRRKSTHCVERIADRFKPNEDFNQTISFGSNTLFTPKNVAGRGKKNKTAMVEQENVNYENFAESIPNSYTGNFTSTTRKEKHIFEEIDVKEVKVPFGDVTNKKIAKKKNLNKVIMGLQGKKKKVPMQSKTIIKSEPCPVQEKFGKMGKRKDLNSIINGLWLKQKAKEPDFL